MMQAENLKRHLPAALLGLSSLVLLASLASAYSSLFPTVQKPGKQTASAVTQQKTASKKNNLDEISEWHLFGNAEKKAAIRTPVRAATETRLKLTLKGLVFTGNEKLDWAIISSPGKRDKTYQVSETVPGNAKLHSIEADKVLLERNGRLESLSLPKVKSYITIVEE